MFLSRHCKRFLSRLLCPRSVPKVLNLPFRVVSTGVCSHKEDVYIQRVTKRFSETVCEFPLQMDPNCKVAIITGGETGIGLAAAKDLLTNGVQMVVLAGVGEGEKVVNQISEEHGQGRACFMHMDVNDPRDFEELFYRVFSIYGGIDIIFNNAGILQDHVWEYEVDVNLKGVLRGTLLGLDYMGKEGRSNKGQGVIINHSDTAALDTPHYYPYYVATKAGIMAASQSFGAKETYKNTGVRVVCLLTGPTNTALIHNVGDKQFSPKWGKAAATSLSQVQPQSSEVVGRAVTHLVKYAPPGSLWTVERGELSITRIPHRSSFSTKVTQL